MQALTRAHIENYPSAGCPRILQFGTGNFLRAFLGPIIQRLNEDHDFKGRTLVVKNTKSVNERYTELTKQDGLYHVLTRGLKGSELMENVELIKHVDKIIHPWLEPEAFLRLGEVPTLEYLISNTTEAGIVYDPQLSIEDFPIANFPAMLTHLLYRRYNHFEGSKEYGWTVIPCELIPDNGKQLKTFVMRYAKRWYQNAEFLQWVDETVLFCNSLVDRIVPGFPVREAPAIQEKITYSDKLIVSAEPYLFWAIEASDQVREKFPIDRLGFDIYFTEDLQEYRNRKIRILNGAHTAMVPIGLLAGVETVGAVMKNDSLEQLIRQIIFNEILPTLAYPIEDLKDYAEKVIVRFQNPFIAHHLYDISMNSISKFRVRVLPSILAYHQKTRQWPNGLLLAFASLIRYYKGDIRPLRDAAEHMDFFDRCWKRYDTHQSTDQLIGSILSYEEAWGVDLSNASELSDHLRIALDQVMSEFING